MQAIGGWSSLRMVERCAHVNDAELARAVRVTHEHTNAAINAPTKTPTVEKTAQPGSSGEGLIPEVTSPMPVSWNQIAGWLRQLDALRAVA